MQLQLRLLPDAIGCKHLRVGQQHAFVHEALLAQGVAHLLSDLLLHIRHSQLSAMQQQFQLLLVAVHNCDENRTRLHATQSPSATACELWQRDVEPVRPFLDPQTTANNACSAVRCVLGRTRGWMELRHCHWGGPWKARSSGG